MEGLEQSMVTNEYGSLDDNAICLERSTMQTVPFNIYSTGRQALAPLIRIDHNLSVIIDESDHRLYRSPFLVPLFAGTVPYWLQPRNGPLDPIMPGYVQRKGSILFRRILVTGGKRSRFITGES